MTPLEYYSSCPLWLPSNPQWRQFKFIKDGFVFIVPDRIRNEAILRKWLVRIQPEHVYYSLSSWLNPVEVRQGYVTKSANVLLSKAVITHDFKFDIDAENLDEAKQKTLEITDFFNEKGLKYEVNYSGMKGFHSRLTDFKFDIPANIKDREGIILDQKADIVNEMQERNLDIDVNISLDLRRVIRLIGTVHGSTGNVCEFVDHKKINEYEPRNIGAMQ